MILDALLQLSDSQALTGTGAVSTNTIDLAPPSAAPRRDIGVGEPMTLVSNVEVALAGTGPTLEVQVLQSDNADLSSPDVVATSGTISGAANAPAGLIVEVPIPPGRVTKRYLGAKHVLGGTTPTATVSCWLQPWDMASLAKPTHYAKGYSV